MARREAGSMSQSSSTLAAGLFGFLIGLSVTGLLLIAASKLIMWVWG